MKKILLLTTILISLISGNKASAQDIKASYFMDKNYLRTSLNPALTPERGYIALPIISGVNMSVGTNGLTVDKLLYKNGSGGLVTFLDPSVKASDFYSKLRDNNSISAKINTKLLGTGFFTNSGKSYWTLDFGVRGTAQASIPKDLFVFIKSGMNEESTNYSFAGMGANICLYSETSLGYARKINDRLTVGTKVKFLAGIANFDVNIDKMDVNLNRDKWVIENEGSMNFSVQGLLNDKLLGGEKYSGLAGVGMAMDLGVEYKVLDNLKISAAVNDIGMMQWMSGSTTSSISQGQVVFEGFSNDASIDELFEGVMSFADFETVDSKKITNFLDMNINVGAEYSLLNDKIGLGLLYSTEFNKYSTDLELTLSSNFRPVDWFAITLSYSMSNNSYKALGYAVNISPGWIHLFFGSDYAICKVTPQFVPVSQSEMNFYFGLAVPLTKKNR